MDSHTGGMGGNWMPAYLGVCTPVLTWGIEAALERTVGMEGRLLGQPTHKHLNEVIPLAFVLSFC